MVAAVCNSSQRWRARFEASQRCSRCRAPFAGSGGPCRGVSAARALPRVLQSTSFTAITTFWSLSRRHHRHCSIALHQHNRLALQKPGCSSRGAAYRTQPLCSLATAASPQLQSCTVHRALAGASCTRTCSAQASHHTCTARIVSKDGGTRRQRRPLPRQTARSRKPEIDLCRLRRM